VNTVTKGYIGALESLIECARDDAEHFERPDYTPAENAEMSKAFRVIANDLADQRDRFLKLNGGPPHVDWSKFPCPQVCDALSEVERLTTKGTPHEPTNQALSIKT